MTARDSALYGLVLAGGHSRRFGRDKAAQVVDGQTLLARTVALAARFARKVYVGVRADQLDDELRCEFAVLADEPGVTGPAAALLAAQGRHPDAAWLVLACDLPQLDAVTLADLRAARDAGSAAVALRSPSDRQPEPLCAIYEPVALEALRTAVAAGRVSPRALLVSLKARLIDARDPSALINMNRPEDLGPTANRRVAQ
jgi:molybdopterin-guanine dinucleotide biosynthesis protein A